MGTTKQHSLTVDTFTAKHLTVTGTVTFSGGAAPAPVEAPPAPVLPEKVTVAALADAYRELVDTLITAGTLSAPVAAPDAPEAPVDAPAPASPAPARAQVVAAGVVDGA